MALTNMEEGEMKKFYYRAEYFPTGHGDEDMLWLDYPATTNEGAWAKAKQWESDHEGYSLVGIHALPREQGDEYPREEPAEYACDYHLGNPKRGILSRLFPVSEAVSRDGHADGAIESLDGSIDFGGRALDPERLMDAIEHSVMFERFDEQMDTLGVVERHGGELLLKVQEIPVVLDKLVEEFGLVFRKPFHERIVTRLTRYPCELMASHGTTA